MYSLFIFLICKYFHMESIYLCVYVFKYFIVVSSYTLCAFKVEECNEPSCKALIFPYGVVLFNIFSTTCI